MPTDQERAELAEAVRKMIPQALIAVVKRAGGSLRLPVSLIDDTSRHWLEVKIEGTDFVFTVMNKN